MYSHMTLFRAALQKPHDRKVCLISPLREKAKRVRRRETAFIFVCAVIGFHMPAIFLGVTLR